MPCCIVRKSLFCLLVGKVGMDHRHPTAQALQHARKTSTSDVSFSNNVKFVFTGRQNWHTCLQGSRFLECHSVCSGSYSFRWKVNLKSDRCHASQLLEPFDTCVFLLFSDKVLFRVNKVFLWSTGKYNISDTYVHAAQMKFQKQKTACISTSHAKEVSLDSYSAFFCVKRPWYREHCQEIFSTSLLTWQFLPFFLHFSFQAMFLFYVTQHLNHFVLRSSSVVGKNIINYRSG